MDLQDLGNSSSKEGEGNIPVRPLKTFIEGLNLDEEVDHSQDLQQSSFPPPKINGDWGVRVVDSPQKLASLLGELENEPLVTFTQSLNSRERFIALGFPSQEEVVVIQVNEGLSAEALFKNYRGKVVTFDQTSVNTNSTVDLLNIHDSFSRLWSDFRGQSLEFVARFILKEEGLKKTDRSNIEMLHSASELTFKLYLKLEKLITEGRSIPSSAERDLESRKIVEQKLNSIDLEQFLKLRAREEFLNGEN